MKTAASVALLLGLIEGVSAQIKILQPDKLVKYFASTNGRIQGSTSTFGTPYFRHSLIGKVIYPASKDDEEKYKGKPHCYAEQYTLPASDQPNEANSWQQDTPPWILMVDRGGCTFRQKVYVAQQKDVNIKAVIIVDNKEEELSRIIVADDGWGKNVEIPSILIGKKDGEQIKTQMKKAPLDADAVFAEMNWDIPQSDVVVMEQWLSSANKADMEFMSEFAHVRENFGHQLQFNPHFVLHTGWSWDSEACYEPKGGKKYCYTDTNLAGKVHGKEVVLEDLRMMCIHHSIREPIKTKHGAEYSPKFWQYMEKFARECPIQAQGDPQNKFGKECSHRVMGAVGIDLKKIEKCLEDNEAQFLDEMSKRKAWSDDATTLNGARLPGDRNVLGVANAICDGYNKPPNACQSIRAKGTQEQPPAPQSSKSSKGNQLALMLASFGIVTIVAFGGVVLYQRSLRAHLHSALREEVMLEVQSQMESYKQLPS